MSACSSIYTVQDEDFNLPPASSKGPTTQAWGAIPTVLETKVATPSVSAISQDEFDKQTRANAKLERKVEELTEQVQALLLLTQKQSTANTPPDIKSIVAETMKEYMKSVYKDQAKATQQNALSPPGSPIQPANMSIDLTRNDNESNE